MEQTDLKLITTEQPLSTRLNEAHRRYLTASDPQEKFKWLVIRAAIEAKLNRTNEPKRGIIE